MCIAHAVCGATHVTVAALFCSISLLCTSNSDWATENEAGRSVSVNGNEEPAGEICHQYSSVVTAIIPYSRTIKLQSTLLGDYWVFVRPARLSVLTWVPSSVPPGNNIQGTFHDVSTQEYNTSTGRDDTWRYAIPISHHSSLTILLICAVFPSYSQLVQVLRISVTKWGSYLPKRVSQSSVNACQILM